MLNKIFILVLLPNLMGLYPVIAPRLKVDLATVSLIALALSCIYITVNYRIARHIFRRKHIFYWLIFLLVWHLLVTSYAPMINFRELGLQVYYLTLLLATTTYLKKRFNSFHQIITASIIITIFGLILCMFTTAFFNTKI